MNRKQILVIFNREEPQLFCKLSNLQASQIWFICDDQIDNLCSFSEVDSVKYLQNKQIIANTQQNQQQAYKYRMINSDVKANILCEHTIKIYSKDQFDDTNRINQYKYILRTREKKCFFIKRQKKELNQQLFKISYQPQEQTGSIKKILLKNKIVFQTVKIQAKIYYILKDHNVIILLQIDSISKQIMKCICKGSLYMQMLQNIKLLMKIGSCYLEDIHQMLGYYMSLDQLIEVYEYETGLIAKL